MSDAPPRILAPAAGQAYVLAEGASAATSRLMLKAAARTGRLHWFVDGTYVAATAPLEPVYWPLRRGAHTILCAADSGRSCSVGIVVR